MAEHRQGSKSHDEKESSQDCRCRSNMHHGQQARKEMPPERWATRSGPLPDYATLTKAIVKTFIFLCASVVFVFACVILGCAAVLFLGRTIHVADSIFRTTVHRPHDGRQSHGSTWFFPREDVVINADGAQHWVQTTRRQAVPAEGNITLQPLQTFSVDVPLLDLGRTGRTVVGAGTPDGFEGIETDPDDAALLAGCQVTLAVNVFANSYGTPFVGNYTPPGCLSGSNTAVMNLTVKSQGRQFDRLAIVYLGDTEVFRTSTEEPRTQGISYTYMKDMSQYMALWQQPQKVIFDLPNVVDPGLTPPITGTFNTTLTVSFFPASHALAPADTIIPISARKSNSSQPSVFTIPNEDNSTASAIVTNFPRNVARAILTVSATGQAEEEFWWTNVLQSGVETWSSPSSDAVTLFGFSPFREVQVLIDGQLAGVQWPYPVIFTGGVVPSLWSPMVGIDAFDLKEGEIDITPWLGLLCDGLPHNFSINVVGLNDEGVSAELSSGVGSNWQVTGKVFIWLDPDPKSITTGPSPSITGLQPTIAISQSVAQNTTGANDTLHYTTSVSRALNILGSITTSTGTRAVSWTQSLNHTDAGVLSNRGGNQLNSISTRGTDTSTSPEQTFSTTYSYPLSANVSSTLLSNGSTRIDANLTRTKATARTADGFVSPNGLQVFAALPPTSGLVGNMKETSMAATQSGQAVLLISPNGTTTSSGSGTQRLRFGGGSDQALGNQADVELYLRDVSVESSGRVVSDAEFLAGRDVVSNRPPATGVGVTPGLMMESVVMRQGAIRARGAG